MSHACSIFERRHTVHRSHKPKVGPWAPSSSHHTQKFAFSFPLAEHHPPAFFALCACSVDWGHVAGRWDARGRARVSNAEDKSRVSCGVRFPLRIFFPDMSFIRPSTRIPVRGRCVHGLYAPAEQKKVGSSGKFFGLLCLFARRNILVLVFPHSVCFSCCCSA